MKKNRNGKKATEKKATPTKQAKGPLGKTTKMTRTSWFIDFFRSHKGHIPTDDKILAKAVAEFGKENVGAGTVFTPKTMRGWWNTFCRRGSRGLAAKDAIIQTVEE